MTIQRFRPGNMENWGKLVKTWATGENKLGDGQDYPVPQSLEELKDQLVKAEVGATIPDYVSDLKFVSEPKEVMVVRLPPKDMIADSEAMLTADPSYPLPPFYQALFNSAANPTIGRDEIMKVHAQRIGDYTCSICT